MALCSRRQRVLALMLLLILKRLLFGTRPQNRRAAASSDRGRPRLMHLVTSETVDRPIERGEIVYACAISGANILRDMREAVVNTLGGHMTKYEALLDKTIARALDGLSERAREKGYDGVLGIRITHPYITSGAIEVVVTGTGFRYARRAARREQSCADRNRDRPALQALTHTNVEIGCSSVLRAAMFACCAFAANRRDAASAPYASGAAPTTGGATHGSEGTRNSHLPAFDHPGAGGPVHEILRRDHSDAQRRDHAILRTAGCLRRAVFGCIMRGL